MPRHLGLDFHQFLASVPADLIDRYLERFQIQHPSRPYFGFHVAALEAYLADPPDPEAAALIAADLRQINDISNETLGLLARAYQKYLLRFDPELNHAHLAMLLFLDHPAAFDFAWSRYLLFATEARLSVHHLGAAPLAFDADQMEAFRRGIARWFAEQAKGEQCEVAVYEERGEQLLHIRHGAHIRTINLWEHGAVTTTSFRPAQEDVLVYEPDTGLLRVKASSPQEREAYVRAFCAAIAGDASLAETALATEVFSLDPLTTGQFNYDGDGPVLRVDLVRAKLKLYGVANTRVDIRATNVVDAFRYDLGGLGITSGVLTSATLRFFVRPQGCRERRLTFTVEPPCRTDLAEKPYADVVLRYLTEERVKLR